MAYYASRLVGMSFMTVDAGSVRFSYVALRPGSVVLLLKIPS